VDSALRQLQARWHRAYVTADSAQLEQLLAPAARVTRSSGLQLERQRMLGYYRGRDTSVLSIWTEASQVHRAGGVAMLTARVREEEGQGRVAYLVADLFRRDSASGRWRLEYSQWTVVPGQWRAVALDSAAVQSLVGRYADPEGRVYLVERGANGLRVQGPSGRVNNLVPRSATHFFVPDQPGELVFPRSESMPPTHAILISGITSTVLHRLPASRAGEVPSR
jgi:hypothetical protein